MKLRLLVKVRWTLIVVFSLFSLTSLSQDLDKSEKKADKMLKKGKVEKALKLYSRSLIIDSNDAFALFKRGFCYLHLDSLERAESDLKRSLELNPLNYKVHRELGSVYSRRHQYDLAIVHFEIAFKNEVKFSSLYLFDLGTAYFFLEDYDEAIEIYDQLYQQGEQLDGVVNNLGWCYIDTDPAKSCTYFGEAFELDSLSVHNINNLGYSHLLCGDLDEAKSAF